MFFAVRHALTRPVLLALLVGVLLVQPFGSTTFLPASIALAQTVPTPDPTLLPVATILQFPLVAPYNALNI
ncbi:MAG TPA: hypothetical protein VNA31_09875, partial [bacterium]|nr:hypothetical protein [bacterium]